MNRRALLATGTAAFGVLTLANLAFSNRALAATETETKTVSYDKLFPFLSNYYDLPPSERTLFRMTYKLMVKGAQPDQVGLVLNAGGVNQRLSIDAHGLVSPLPTPEQVKAKATLTYTRPAGAEFGANLMIIPTAPLQQTMDAAALNGAVSQTVAGSRKIAGIMAMALPKFDRVMIFGPAAVKVVLASGEARSLPVKATFVDKNGQPHPNATAYVPAEWPTAKSLSFDSVPLRILVTPAS